METKVNVLNFENYLTEPEGGKRLNKNNEKGEPEWVLNKEN
jgi:hypothetical protein